MAVVRIVYVRPSIFVYLYILLKNQVVGVSILDRREYINNTRKLPLNLESCKSRPKLRSSCLRVFACVHCYVVKE